MQSGKKRPAERSAQLFSRSRDVIPGGVNSPVRAFKSVGYDPFVVERGEGAWIEDVDGNRYVDYVMSWGPLILGHAPDKVLQTIVSKTASGTSFGAPTGAELDLAVLVKERMPWVEKLRLVSSGTEACMTAARIARGATDRRFIVKFDGGYHGHSDGFLVQAGSGLATGNLPASSGVPEEVTSVTLSLPYNDLQAVREAFERYGEDIAALIIEPVAANMGVIPPEPGYLNVLRELTSQHGALFILDEVITGFRVAPGGAAELYDIKPDLVCLGKILGGGLPIGAVGGKAELMDVLAPEGAVYQAGTLSGNPISTAAGIATLKELEDPTVYDLLRQYADDLCGGITELFEKHGHPLMVNRVESLFTLFFSSSKVTDFESAKRSDMENYAAFFRSMLTSGIFLAPSGFEAWFVSTAHGKAELDLTLRAVERFLEE
jgi:glutamate-1-semialdehyde 2,1-aminomutase